MALSTHAGGAADKAGFFHESLWGIHCMLDVLDGGAESIRIETPGDDGAEFYLRRANVREHWQAKRQVTGQGTWSFEKLKGVLEFFFQKFRAGESCVFASVSDAPELRMLTENAQAVKKAGEGLDHFKAYFLDRKRAAQFTELQKLVGAATEQETFDFLCSVTIHGGREITLESLIGFGLTARFQPPWQTTVAALRELYLRSTHETLTAADIERHLRKSNIERRRAGTTDARDRIHDVTNNYVLGQRAKLIRGTPIIRSVATDIVNKIQTSNISLDILIAAPAGGGKSACLCQIVEGLREVGIPVLAFRLDRIEPVPTVIQLGGKLGLGESPAFVLSETFSHQPVVLVVDQLDCVSTSSGRHPDFFDTVASLRAEVVGLRLQRRIHLVFACRKFDFKHDYRLKQLITKDQQPIELGELTVDEVKSVLRQEDGDFSKLTLHQQTMLRLPQNLSLYIDADLTKSKNLFSTPKELCDAYWLAKRRAVSVDRPDFDQHWLPAITHLAKTMSDRQELSIPAAAMDQFSPDFLERMASEGVLSWDGKRYGFGHETFFDYCFARTQPNGGRDFVKFLEGDMQHLFRRAQLRQILAFLRDDDFSTYLTSIEYMLKSERIRPHLKLLAVELLAIHPQAYDEELDLLIPWIENELSFRREGKRNSDKLASRIWERFFSSGTLFTVADRMGLIQRWLNSGESWLQDTMAVYLRWQTEEHSERIAELLEPFVEDPEWRMRLRQVMEWGNLEKSRRFFGLFLRLIDDGTLDEAKDRFVSNGTFWSMLHGFAEQRPEWCAELAARWLDRRVLLASATPEAADDLRSYFSDQFGVDDLFKSARGAPNAFLKNVLPAVLRAAATFAYNADEDEFSRDRLWPERFQSEHIGLLEAFLSGCENALELVGQSTPEQLRPSIDKLLMHRLYTANHLLMSAYLSSPATFAEEALSLLIAEPKRLRCGFLDNSYWHSRQLIQTCSPHCTGETFQKLEACLLAFVSPYERSKNGFRYRGHAAFNLASALDEHRLSVRGKAQLAEWREKYKAPDSPPVGIRSYAVGSPIEEDAAEHMTDEQWLGAIAKYNTEEWQYNHRHPEKGGALELARMLQKFTEKEPERFALLALQFPSTAHPYYFSHVLSGLRKSAVSNELKLDVARRVFKLDHHDCFRAALDILGSVTEIELPEDAINYIQRTGDHPNPEKELWDGERPYYGGDILTHGINSVRGFVAETIRDLVLSDARYLSIFRSTIDNLVGDQSLAVRSCAASTLLAVAQHDAKLAVDWTGKLFDADDRLLTTRYVQDLIHRGVREYPGTFSPVIERMLQSTHGNVRESGGLLACLARLYHKSAERFSEGALNGDEYCRLGACEVAKGNLLYADCREWCEAALIRLFNDESQGVRKKAAGCFWHLWHSPETPLTEFDTLIRGFLASPAFADEPTYLLHALEETKHKVPEAALDVCETFIARCSEDARNIRTSMAGNENTIGKLVFTSYAQLQVQQLQVRALNAIDQMNLEGLNSASTHLAEFER